MGSFIIRTTAVLRRLGQEPGLLLARLMLDGHPGPDAHTPADQLSMLSGEGRRIPGRRALRLVVLVPSAGISHREWQQRLPVRLLTSPL